MYKYFVIVGLLLLTSCQDDDNNPTQTLEVFKQAPNVLCGSGVGEGYTQSAQALIDGGIDVISSRCAFVVDQSGAIECNYFERVNIHAIHTPNLQDAENLGYQNLESLSRDYGLSLSDTECNWE